MAQIDQHPHRPWLGLRAVVPSHAWQHQFDLSICLFDINGNIFSHLITSDQIDHPRVIVSARNDSATSAEQLRTRHIQIDLAAITSLSSPTVMAISAGIISKPGTYLHDLARAGAKLELHLENPLGERPVTLFEFPLLYSRNTNNQILFSLLRDRSGEFERLPGDETESVENSHSAASADPLDRWLLRFSINTNQPTNALANLEKRFSEEWLINGTLIRHQSFQGCVPLKRLVNQSTARKDSERISGQYTSGQSGMQPSEWQMPPTYSDGKGSLILPFDRISWILKCMHKKQEVTDQNMRDLAEMMTSMVSTVNAVSDESSVTSRLCDGIENLETLFLEMYQQAAEKARIFEELIGGASTLELDGPQRKTQIDAIPGVDDSIDLTPEEVHMLETFAKWKNYNKSGRTYDRTGQRYELYSQYMKDIQTCPGQVERILARVKEPYQLENSHTIRQSQMNRVPINYPPKTEAYHTLSYDDGELY